MARKKISPSLEKEILAKAAGGESARAISQWLLADRGIKVSHQAVGNLLRQTRTERADVAKAVVREVLTRTVTSDLDRLTREQRRTERLTRRLHKRAAKALEVLERDAAGEEVSSKELRAALLTTTALADLALKATDRVAKLAQMKLRLSGADADDERVDFSKMSDEELDAYLGK